MELRTFIKLKDKIILSGFESDIEWSEKLKPCDSPEKFVLDFIFVLCNSGMKAQIAVKIYKKILIAVCQGRKISEVFGHAGKVSAIEKIISNKDTLFQEFKNTKSELEKIEWCGKLPWIGPITKYHLAKNLGVDCAKPDRHLVREANLYSITVEELCKDLAEKTNYRISTVDVILWRAGNLGILPYQKKQAVIMR